MIKASSGKINILNLIRLTGDKSVARRSLLVGRDFWRNLCALGDLVKIGIGIPAIFTVPNTKYPNNLFFRERLASFSKMTLKHPGLYSSLNPVLGLHGTTFLSQISSD